VFVKDFPRKLKYSEPASRFATPLFFFTMWFHLIASERQKARFRPMEAVFQPFGSVVSRLWKGSFQTLEGLLSDFKRQPTRL
jgi:hypothetical protein